MIRLRLKPYQIYQRNQSITFTSTTLVTIIYEEPLCLSHLEAYLPYPYYLHTAVLFLAYINIQYNAYIFLFNDSHHLLENTSHRVSQHKTLNVILTTAASVTIQMPATTPNNNYTDF